MGTPRQPVGDRKGRAPNLTQAKVRLAEDQTGPGRTGFRPLSHLQGTARLSYSVRGAFSQAFDRKLANQVTQQKHSLQSNQDPLAPTSTYLTYRDTQAKQPKSHTSLLPAHATGSSSSPSRHPRAGCNAEELWRQKRKQGRGSGWLG